MIEPAYEQQPSWRLWSTAAAVAVALHLGGAALALAHLHIGENSDGIGAYVPTIGIDLVSPAAEDNDLPAGPDTEAVAASPALAAQEAEVRPTDLPKEMPKESDDPDRLVTSSEQKRPARDDPKTEAVQTAASQEMMAQEATARRRLADAQQASTAAAPNIGIGKDQQILSAKWGKQISAYFELHKRYPKTDKVKPAKVTLSLVLNRLGHVVSLAVAESSGDPLFDEAALDMVRRSDPVPRPPAALTDDTFNRSLVVNFNGRK